MSHTVKIKFIEPITHDVNHYIVEKPKDYSFVPGQATEVAINHPDWKDEKRPFTFTALPDSDVLEFVIKSYHDHDGVTHRLDKLKAGDELIIDDAWGAIQYQGRGIFIAGGAGVTPFIAILKDLKSKGKLKGNRLFFGNKTGKDVILESYFQDILGEDFVSVLSREKLDGHEHGLIDMEFLKKHVVDFSQEFYVCGPPEMVDSVITNLKMLGANPDGIVFEE